MGELTDFERGLVIGLLVGQGHFGGDGRQPQITVKLHVRHEQQLRRLQTLFPRTRLYGPYEHGDRHFFQWMARGRALVQDVLPVLDPAVVAEVDDHAAGRLAQMRERYADSIARHRAAGEIV